MQACHRNGDQIDNRLENLRWGTPQENADDRIRHGTQARGEDSAQAKLTEADVLEIRASALSQSALAARFGVCQSRISLIRSGRSWKHMLSREVRADG